MEYIVFCLVREEKANLFKKFFKELSVKVRSSKSSTLPKNFGIFYVSSIRILKDRLKVLDSSCNVTIVYDSFLSTEIRGLNSIYQNLSLITIDFHKNQGRNGIIYTVQIRTGTLYGHIDLLAKKIVALDRSISQAI